MPAGKADNFTICEPKLKKCGILNVSKHNMTPRPVRGIASLTLLIYVKGCVYLIPIVRLEALG
jgi:hypothetical protein